MLLERVLETKGRSSEDIRRVRIRWLRPNVARVTHADAQGAFPSDRPWLEHVLLPGGMVGDSGTPSLDDFTPEFDFQLQQGCLSAIALEGGFVFSEARPPTQGIRQWKPYGTVDIPKTDVHLGVRRVDAGVRLAFSIQPGEAFYGWGEWFNAFQRQQGQVKLRIRDSIAMLQGRETYSGIPVFYSSRGYALWLLNSYASHWQIDPAQGVMEVQADGPGADYLLIYGPTFKRILQTYTGLTGRPPLLPRWAFGLWVTSYPQGHQDGVVEHVRQHRQRDIPLDAVILDYHWEQAYHNFQWRRSLIPEPERLIAELNELGVRLGLILTPFVNKGGRPFQKAFLKALASNIPPGMDWDDERDLAGYEEARSHGWLAHEKARWWFGLGGMPDFTNPQAAAWWNARMQPLYAQGVRFFKNDDGEYLPEDARSSLGMDGREYHNLYGFFYGRALYEGFPPSLGRPMIYARSVWAGSQRYPALFLGDQKPTCVGIRSTLRAGLNLGLLGFAYWTADVFGLDGKTTPEMHMRYAQWALLAPVARYFLRPSHIDDTRFPWSHGPEVETNFRKYAELRYRLLPYYLCLGWEAWQSGLPLVRPLALEFQERPELAAVDDQVMLGERLMICPIVEPGATARRILLPPGDWHDFWSGQSWQGPAAIDYPAPLDRLPLLVRGGSVLPMGESMPYIPEAHRLEQVQFHVWPPYPAQGMLYDDDGRSLAYQQGLCSVTRLEVRGQAGGLVVQISAAQGDFPEQVKRRRAQVVLHRCPAPQQVRVAGEITAAWQYAAEAGELTIPLEYEVQAGVDVSIDFASSK